MNTYIHYGHSNFDKRNMFNNIKNNDYMNKPSGGLWASLVNDNNSWINWVTREKFNVDKYNEHTWFKFIIKEGSNILYIDNANKLYELKCTHLTNSFLKYICYDTLIDWEYLSNIYDGVFVDFSKDTSMYSILDMWDCNTLLIFNPDCITVIESSNDTI